MSKTATIRAQIEPRRRRLFAIKIPNTVTAKTLLDSRRGRGVKPFTAKRELFADLGL